MIHIYLESKLEMFQISNSPIITTSTISQYQEFPKVVSYITDNPDNNINMSIVIDDTCYSDASLYSQSRISNIDTSYEHITMDRYNNSIIFNSKLCIAKHNDKGTVIDDRQKESNFNNNTIRSHLYLNLITQEINSIDRIYCNGSNIQNSDTILLRNTIPGYSHGNKKCLDVNDNIHVLMRKLKIIDLKKLSNSEIYYIVENVSNNNNNSKKNNNDDSIHSTESKISLPRYLWVSTKLTIEKNHQDNETLDIIINKDVSQIMKFNLDNPVNNRFNNNGINEYKNLSMQSKNKINEVKKNINLFKKYFPSHSRRKINKIENRNNWEYTEDSDSELSDENNSLRRFIDEIKISVHDNMNNIERTYSMITLLKNKLITMVEHEMHESDDNLFDIDRLYRREVESMISLPRYHWVKPINSVQDHSESSMHDVTLNYIKSKGSDTVDMIISEHFPCLKIPSEKLLFDLQRSIDSSVLSNNINEAISSLKYSQNMNTQLNSELNASEISIKRIPFNDSLLNLINIISNGSINLNHNELFEETSNSNLRNPNHGRTTQEYQISDNMAYQTDIMTHDTTYANSYYTTPSIHDLDDITTKEFEIKSNYNKTKIQAQPNQQYINSNTKPIMINELDHSITNKSHESESPKKKIEMNIFNLNKILDNSVPLTISDNEITLENYTNYVNINDCTADTSETRDIDEDILNLNQKYNMNSKNNIETLNRTASIDLRKTISDGGHTDKNNVLIHYTNNVILKQDEICDTNININDENILQNNIVAAKMIRNLESSSNENENTGYNKQILTSNDSIHDIISDTWMKTNYSSKTDKKNNIPTRNQFQDLNEIDSCNINNKFKGNSLDNLNSISMLQETKFRKIKSKDKLDVYNINIQDINLDIHDELEINSSISKLCEKECYSIDNTIKKEHILKSIVSNKINTIQDSENIIKNVHDGDEKNGYLNSILLSDIKQETGNNKNYIFQNHNMLENNSIFKHSFDDNDSINKSFIRHNENDIKQERFVDLKMNYCISRENIKDKIIQIMKSDDNDIYEIAEHDNIFNSLEVQNNFNSDTHMHSSEEIIKVKSTIKCRIDENEKYPTTMKDLQNDKLIMKIEKNDILYDSNLTNTDNVTVKSDHPELTSECILFKSISDNINLEIDSRFQIKDTDDKLNTNNIRNNDDDTNSQLIQKYNNLEDNFNILRNIHNSNDCLMIDKHIIDTEERVNNLKSDIIHSIEYIKSDDIIDNKILDSKSNLQNYTHPIDNLTESRDTLKYDNKQQYIQSNHSDNDFEANEYNTQFYNNFNITRKKSNDGIYNSRSSVSVIGIDIDISNSGISEDINSSICNTDIEKKMNNSIVLTNIFDKDNILPSSIHNNIDMINYSKVFSNYDSEYSNIAINNNSIKHTQINNQLVNSDTRLAILNTDIIDRVDNNSDYSQRINEYISVITLPSETNLHQTTIEPITSINNIKLSDSDIQKNINNSLVNTSIDDIKKNISKLDANGSHIHNDKVIISSIDMSDINTGNKSNITNIINIEGILDSTNIIDNSTYQKLNDSTIFISDDDVNMDYKLESDDDQKINLKNRIQKETKSITYQINTIHNNINEIEHEINYIQENNFNNDKHALVENYTDKSKINIDEKSVNQIISSLFLDDQIKISNELLCIDPEINYSDQDKLIISEVSKDTLLNHDGQSNNKIILDNQANIDSILTNNIKPYTKSSQTNIDSLLNMNSTQDIMLRSQTNLNSIITSQIGMNSKLYDYKDKETPLTDEINIEHSLDNNKIHNSILMIENQNAVLPLETDTEYHDISLDKKNIHPIYSDSYYNKSLLSIQINADSATNISNMDIRPQVQNSDSILTSIINRELDSQEQINMVKILTNTANLDSTVSDQIKDKQFLNKNKSDAQTMIPINKEKLHNSITKLDSKLNSMLIEDTTLYKGKYVFSNNETVYNGLFNKPTKSDQSISEFTINDQINDSQKILSTVNVNIDSINNINENNEIDTKLNLINNSTHLSVITNIDTFLDANSGDNSDRNINSDIADKNIHDYSDTIKSTQEFSSISEFEFTMNSKDDVIKENFINITNNDEISNKSLYNHTLNNTIKSIKELETNSYNNLESNNITDIKNKESCLEDINNLKTNSIGLLNSVDNENISLYIQNNMNDVKDTLKFDTFSNKSKHDVNEFPKDINLKNSSTNSSLKIKNSSNTFFRKKNKINNPILTKSNISNLNPDDNINNLDHLNNITIIISNSSIDLNEINKNTYPNKIDLGYNNMNKSTTSIIINEDKKEKSNIMENSNIDNIENIKTNNNGSDNSINKYSKSKRKQILDNNRSIKQNINSIPLSIKYSKETNNNENILTDSIKSNNNLILNGTSLPADIDMVNSNINIIPNNNELSKLKSLEVLNKYKVITPSDDSIINNGCINNNQFTEINSINSDVNIEMKENIFKNNIESINTLKSNDSNNKILVNFKKLNNNLIDNLHSSNSSDFNKHNSETHLYNNCNQNINKNKQEGTIEESIELNVKSSIKSAEQKVLALPFYTSGTNIKNEINSSIQIIKSINGNTDLEKYNKENTQKENISVINKSIETIITSVESNTNISRIQDEFNSRYSDNIAIDTINSNTKNKFEENNADTLSNKISDNIYVQSLSSYQIENTLENKLSVNDKISKEQKMDISPITSIVNNSISIVSHISNLQNEVGSSHSKDKAIDTNFQLNNKYEDNLSNEYVDSMNRNDLYSENINKSIESPLTTYKHNAETMNTYITKSNHSNFNPDENIDNLDHLDKLNDMESKTSNDLNEINKNSYPNKIDRGYNYMKKSITSINIIEDNKEKMNIMENANVDSQNEINSPNIENIDNSNHILELTWIDSNKQLNKDHLIIDETDEHESIKSHKSSLKDEVIKDYGSGNNDFKQNKALVKATELNTQNNIENIKTNNNGSDNSINKYSKSKRKQILDNNRSIKQNINAIPLSIKYSKETNSNENILTDSIKSNNNLILNGTSLPADIDMVNSNINVIPNNHELSKLKSLEVLNKYKVITPSDDSIINNGCINNKQFTEINSINSDVNIEMKENIFKNNIESINTLKSNDSNNKILVNFKKLNNNLIDNLHSSNSSDFNKRNSETQLYNNCNQNINKNKQEGTIEESIELNVKSSIKSAEQKVLALPFYTSGTNIKNEINSSIQIIKSINGNTDLEKYNKENTQKENISVINKSIETIITSVESNTNISRIQDEFNSRYSDNIAIDTINSNTKNKFEENNSDMLSNKISDNIYEQSLPSYQIENTLENKLSVNDKISKEQKMNISPITSIVNNSISIVSHISNLQNEVGSSNSKDKAIDTKFQLNNKYEDNLSNEYVDSMNRNDLYSENINKSIESPLTIYKHNVETMNTYITKSNHSNFNPDENIDNLDHLDKLNDMEFKTSNDLNEINKNSYPNKIDRGYNYMKKSIMSINIIEDNKEKINIMENANVDSQNEINSPNIENIDNSNHILELTWIDSNKQLNKDHLIIDETDEHESIKIHKSSLKDEVIKDYGSGNNDFKQNKALVKATELNTQNNIENIKIKKNGSDNIVNEYSKNKRKQILDNNRNIKQNINSIPLSIKSSKVTNNNENILTDSLKSNNSLLLNGTSLPADSDITNSNINIIPNNNELSKLKSLEVLNKYKVITPSDDSIINNRYVNNNKFTEINSINSDVNIEMKENISKNNIESMNNLKINDSNNKILVNFKKLNNNLIDNLHSSNSSDFNKRNSETQLYNNCNQNINKNKQEGTIEESIELNVKSSIKSDAQVLPFIALPFYTSGTNIKIKNEINSSIKIIENIDGNTDLEKYVKENTQKEKISVINKSIETIITSVESNTNISRIQDEFNSRYSDNIAIDTINTDNKNKFKENDDNISSNKISDNIYEQSLPSYQIENTLENKLSVNDKISKEQKMNISPITSIVNNSISIVSHISNLQNEVDSSHSKDRAIDTKFQLNNKYEDNLSNEYVDSMNRNDLYSENINKSIESPLTTYKHNAETMNTYITKSNHSNFNPDENIDNLDHLDKLNDMESKTSNDLNEINKNSFPNKIDRGYNYMKKSITSINIIEDNKEKMNIMKNANVDSQNEINSPNIENIDNSNHILELTWIDSNKQLNKDHLIIDETDEHESIKSHKSSLKDEVIKDYGSGNNDFKQNKALVKATELNTQNNIENIKTNNNGSDNSINKYSKSKRKQILDNNRSIKQNINAIPLSIKYSKETNSNENILTDSIKSNNNLILNGTSLPADIDMVNSNINIIPNNNELSKLKSLEVLNKYKVITPSDDSIINNRYVNNNKFTEINSINSDVNIEIKENILKNNIESMNTLKSNDNNNKILVNFKKLDTNLIDNLHSRNSSDFNKRNSETQLYNNFNQNINKNKQEGTIEESIELNVKSSIKSADINKSIKTIITSVESNTNISRIQDVFNSRYSDNIAIDNINSNTKNKFEENNDDILSNKISDNIYEQSLPYYQIENTLENKLSVNDKISKEQKMDISPITSIVNNSISIISKKSNLQVGSRYSEDRSRITNDENTNFQLNKENASNDYVDSMNKNDLYSTNINKSIESLPAIYKNDRSHEKSHSLKSSNIETTDKLNHSLNVSSDTLKKSNLSRRQSYDKNDNGKYSIENIGKSVQSIIPDDNELQVVLNESGTGDDLYTHALYTNNKSSINQLDQILNSAEMLDSIKYNSPNISIVTLPANEYVDIINKNDSYPGNINKSIESLPAIYKNNNLPEKIHSLMISNIDTLNDSLNIYSNTSNKSNLSRRQSYDKNDNGKYSIENIGKSAQSIIPDENELQVGINKSGTGDDLYTHALYTNNKSSINQLDQILNSAEMLDSIKYNSPNISIVTLPANEYVDIINKNDSYPGNINKSIESLPAIYKNNNFPEQSHSLIISNIETTDMLNDSLNVSSDTPSKSNFSRRQSYDKNDNGKYPIENIGKFSQSIIPDDNELQVCPNKSGTGDDLYTHANKLDQILNSAEMLDSIEYISPNISIDTLPSVNNLGSNYRSLLDMRTSVNSSNITDIDIKEKLLEDSENNTIKKNIFKNYKVLNSNMVNKSLSNYNQSGYNDINFNSKHQVKPNNNNVLNANIDLDILADKIAERLLKSNYPNIKKSQSEKLKLDNNIIKLPLEKHYSKKQMEKANLKNVANNTTSDKIHSSKDNSNINIHEFDNKSFENNDNQNDFTSPIMDNITSPMFDDEMPYRNEYEKMLWMNTGVRKFPGCYHDDVQDFYSSKGFKCFWNVSQKRQYYPSMNGNRSGTKGYMSNQFTEKQIKAKMIREEVT